MQATSPSTHLKELGEGIVVKAGHGATLAAGTQIAVVVLVLVMQSDLVFLGAAVNLSAQNCCGGTERDERPATAAMR